MLVENLPTYGTPAHTVNAGFRVENPAWAKLHRPTTMQLTLREIQTRHPRLLLIDCASARIQIGLFPSAASASWETASGEAGTMLFSCLEKLLARHALTLDAIDAFAFCEGPGSTLGIRTAATALRTWKTLRERPSYSYQSLTLVAQHLARIEGQRGFTVIADARRETWHALHVSADGQPAPLRRLPPRELTGTLYTPNDFRAWSQPPADVRNTPYDLPALLPALADAPLFQLNHEPDAFLHEERVYQTWTPQIHREHIEARS